MYSNRRQAIPLVIQKQRGVVLLIALVVMLILSLAGVSLLRSVDGSMSLAGNLALRQSAIASSDAGVNRATTWLLNQTATSLWNDNIANGYISSTTFNELAWSSNATWANSVSFNDANGNVVNYMIFRLCTLANSAPNAATQTCNTASGGAGGSTQGNSMGSGGIQFQGNLQLYYRIVVRVQGPKNTTSYVNVIMARGA